MHPNLEFYNNSIHGKELLLNLENSEKDRNEIDSVLLKQKVVNSADSGFNLEFKDHHARRPIH